MTVVNDRGVRSWPLMREENLSMCRNNVLGSNDFRDRFNYRSQQMQMFCINNITKILHYQLIIIMTGNIFLKS